MNKNLKKIINLINEHSISDNNNIESIMNVAAGVITKEGDNGELMCLLIQRSPDDHWPGHWEFPRGCCDKPIGEAIDHCLYREIKEETGLDVEIVKFIDKFEYIADSGKRRSICHNYLCKMKDKNQKVKLSKEHSKFQWVTQIGYVGLMVMPEQRKTLENILSLDNKIINTPKNQFTKNNTIEEYLTFLQ